MFFRLKSRAFPRPKTTLGFALIVVCALVCAALARAQTEHPSSRVLPLHRFAASRLSQTDSTGFHRFATAVGDDYFDGTDSMKRVERHLRAAREAGVKYLRCAFSWNGIEKTQGQYNWTFWDGLVREAETNSIELIPYVAYTPEWAARDPHDFWKQPPRDPELYADFMYRTATRYRGKIRSWELWNEPDNKDYWLGTVEEYAKLVTRASVRIRDANPDAVLVLGGMAYGPGPFLRSLLTAYSADGYVDVVALHAYPESWGSERAEVPFQEWIPATRQLLARSGSGADLWMNETGYPDYRYKMAQASVYGGDVFYKYEHTRRYQAVMLLKFFLMALASDVSLAGWYRIDDFPSSEKRLGTDLVNFHLGLLDVRGRRKPDFYSLRFFNRLFGAPSRTIRVPVTQTRGSRAIVKIFETADRRVLVAGWLRSSQPDEVDVKTGLREDSREEFVSVDLPCTPSPAVHFYDVLGKRNSSRTSVVAKSLRNIRLTGSDVFLAELHCVQE